MPQWFIKEIYNNIYIFFLNVGTWAELLKLKTVTLRHESQAAFVAAAAEHSFSLWL